MLSSTGKQHASPLRPTEQHRVRPRLILACTDLSDVSLPAIRAASSIAGSVGAHLQVVTSFDDSGEVTASNLAEFSEAFAEVEGRLQTLARSLVQPGLEVSALVLRGNAAPAIQRLVEDEEPELVVLGTHGRRGFQRWAMGSTAEAILGAVSCPVLTVGPDASLAGLKGTGPVVFATDFNLGARADLAYALTVALRHRAMLRCIHIRLIAGSGDEDTGIDVVLLNRLRSLIPHDIRAIHKVNCLVISGSNICSDIVSYARAQRACAIVLGVKKHAMLHSHLSPQNLSRILTEADCPVYTLSHSSSEIDMSGTA